MPWEDGAAPNRVSPRECIRNARDDTSRAYGRTRPEHAVIDLRHAVDWLRRALEQMAEADE